MSSEQADRFEASLRATHARIDRRLNRVHEQLDKGRYSLSDTVFGKLLGQRDELANASNDLKLLRSEFELLSRGFCEMPPCYNEAEMLNYILEILKSEKKTGVKR